MPTVRKFLDLSTAHLPAHLGSFSNPSNISTWDRFTIYNHAEYGFFVHVPNEQDMVDYSFDDVPLEVRRIWTYARTLDCDYVLFDRDAAIDPHLPTWEW